MTLDQLKIYELATIDGLESEGAERKQLLDMGITPGTKVKMIRVAPMGDPLEFYLRGYCVSIRKDTASKISITRR